MLHPRAEAMVSQKTMGQLFLLLSPLPVCVGSGLTSQITREGHLAGHRPSVPVRLIDSWASLSPDLSHQALVDATIAAGTASVSSQLEVLLATRPVEGLLSLQICWV